MDPSATLSTLRKLAERILEDFDSADSKESVDAIELASHVNSLDNWILGGGFLPSAWEYLPPMSR